MKKKIKTKSKPRLVERPVIPGPLGLWWLSYAGNGKKLGVVIVYGKDGLNARAEAFKQKLTPRLADECMAYPLDQGVGFEAWVGRLLTVKQANALGARKVGGGV